MLVTVHAKRDKDGMKAAGILPFFTGTTVHEAGKPCDTLENVAGRALRGAHVLRELVRSPRPARTWTRRGRSRPPARCSPSPRPPGLPTPPPAQNSAGSTRTGYRQAAAAGIALNAGRNGKLQDKRHALATRMQARQDDCLRFARDLRVPFTNNEAEVRHEVARGEWVTRKEGRRMMAAG